MGPENQLLAAGNKNLYSFGKFWPDGTTPFGDNADAITGFSAAYPVPAFDPILLAPAVAPAAGGAASAGSAGVSSAAGLVASSSVAPYVISQAAAATHLTINATYGTSITGLATTAPTTYTAITSAITTAVQFLQSTFTNPITINIEFGSGEVGGNPLPSTSVGQSIALGYGFPLTYAELFAAMPASAGLSASDPTPGGSTWFVSSAEAKALNLANVGFLSGLDGYVGISNVLALNYGSLSRAVAGQYDAIGAIEHEITEVLGRVAALGTYVGPNAYAPMDLLRYSAANTRALAPGPGYFSVNGGTTSLAAFNDPTLPAGGDAGDWAGSVLRDSFNAFSTIGVANTVSAVDIQLLSALGFVACYAAGTRIRTPRGDVPIERLTAGDLVDTRFAGSTPIRWIGERRIDCRRHPNPPDVAAVRISAGAFAPGIPKRDLFLSPDHAVQIGDALIPIRLLINGATVRQDAAEAAVHYFHIELDRHDILFADGLPAESYLDTGNRGMFANAKEPLLLHPRLDGPIAQARRESMSCLAFWSEPSRVEPVWRALMERAEQLGFVRPAMETIDDPDLRIVIGDRQVRPLAVRSNRFVFLLPAKSRDIRLRCRDTVPTALRPWIDDRRRLGVMVQRLTIHRGDERFDIAMDDPALTDGWWAAERDNRSIWRWTNGDAALPDLDGSAIIEVLVGETLAYPVPAERLVHPSLAA